MKQTRSRIFAGILVAAVGVLFLLSNLNIFVFSDLLSTWWPSLVIVAGAMILIDNKKDYLWALLVMGVGVVLQLNRFDLDINLWNVLWPAVIIVIGLSLIFRHSLSGKKTISSNEASVTAILGGSQSRVQSKDFTGIRLVAVAGGVELDLRDAIIKKEATIDLFGLWGGIDIRVPSGVIVHNNTSTIFGGVEQNTPPADTTKNAPILHIVGDVIMAGVEIRQ